MRATRFFSRITSQLQIVRVSTFVNLHVLLAVGAGGWIQDCMAAGMGQLDTAVNLAVFAQQ